MAYGDLNDLVARLTTTVTGQEDTRPVALLAGSGLTRGAVPGVVEIITAIRRYLNDDEKAHFDERLAVHEEPGLKYQEAFTFLSLRRAPHFRDRVIRLVTLQAYKGNIDSVDDLKSEKLIEYESDVDNWNLPLGTAALGRIWSGLPSALRGPIVTTNFDPLCEVAIRKAGGVVLPRSMDTDGSFGRDVHALDIPQVIHIHGYWRESATLSMTTQLTQDRPALNGSIRALLSQHTLLVMGYGGWNDAVTRQLTEVIKEQSARDLDILWCYYGSERELEDELQSNSVLNDLLQAPGNVQFYTGIDVNQALPRIEKAISEKLIFPETQRRTNGRGSLFGWIPVAEQLLLPRTKDADDAAALTFFDGRLPNWQDAASELIPRRDVVNTLSNRLRIAMTKKSATLTAIVGASGEGKTTALMQVASTIASTEDVVVLFSGEGRINSVSEIMSLPSTTNHLLVIDDAYRSIERLKELATRCNDEGRTGIHLLVASRDSDWSSVGGFTFAWNRFLPFSHERLRGMSHLDAVAIVNSWESLGAPALGALADIPGTYARISALESAAANDVGVEGAFLGALLSTRYGAGLKEHVKELLLRLSERPIHSLGGMSNDTLLDALFLVAIPHSAGMRTLHGKLLAHVLDVSEQELLGAVLLPLGDEAAIAYNAESVMVRHRSIANSVVDLANDVGVDLTIPVRRLASGAIRLIEREGMKPWLYDFAYLSQKVKDPVLALEAARAAVDAEPRRLSYRTSLSRAYRNADDAVSASALGAESAAMMLTASDATNGIRPMLNEWGVAEGRLGHAALNTVLAGASLQDEYGFGPVLKDHIGMSMTCLAIGLRRLWEANREFVLLNGLAGLIDIAERLTLPSDQRSWVEQAQELVFRQGATDPRDVSSAAQAVSSACKRALVLVENPLPPALPLLHFRFDIIKGFASTW